jgi:hypothetical protein
MSRELYLKLVKLDKSLAEKYRSFKTRALDKPLNKDQARVLFEELMDGDEITRDEASAMHLLLTEKQFDADAMKFLNKITRTVEISLALINGGVIAPLSGQKLDEFNRALGMGMVGKIQFTSPATNSSYNPCHYQTIKELVAKGKMFVFAVFMRGAGSGRYFPHNNAMLLNQEATGTDKLASIVHETTLAIQDWRNMPIALMHGEADAYIAGGVVIRILKQTIPARNADVFHKADKAAELVIKGQASGQDEAWVTAYGDVVEAVKKDPEYSANIGRKDMVEPKGHPDEAKVFEDYLKKLKCKA